VNKGDADFVDRAVDMKAFVKRILRHCQASPRMANTVETGITGRVRFGPKFVRQVQNSSEFKLLRVRRDDPPVGAIYRIMADRGGVNYVEFVLRQNRGEVRIIDMYSYLIGEYSSTSIGYSILPALRELESGRQPSESRRLGELQEVGVMQAALVRGDARTVLKVYSGLSSGFQEERIPLVLRYKAAQMLGSKAPEYKKAVEDMAKNSEGLEFFLFEAAEELGNYDEALEYLDRFERKIGPDGMVCWLRSVVYSRKGDHEKRCAAAERGIRIEPGLSDNYRALMKGAVRTKDWLRTCTTLTQIDKRFPGSISIERLEADYPELARSEAYGQWKALRNKPVSPTSTSMPSGAHR